jgi:hypothetical protein
MIKLMRTSPILILVVIFFVALAIFKKNRVTQPLEIPKTEMPTAAPKSVGSIVSVTIDQKPAAQSSTPFPAFSEPAPPPPTVVSPVLEDPLCLGGKKDYAILPSIYLRDFYKRSPSWAAMPLSYAKCFQKDKDMKFIFYEMQSEFQLPWQQLVTMQGRVSDIQTYDNFSEFQTKNKNLQYAVRQGRNASSSIYQNIQALFPHRSGEKWVQIWIHSNSIEDTPGYWPRSPPLHPVAEFISANELKSMQNKGLENVVYIDVRSHQDIENFKMPYPSIHIGNNKKGFHTMTWAPDRLQTLNFSNAASLQSTYILIGSDEYDHGAINTANFLTLKGYRSIFILKGGVLELGGPRRTRPVSSLSDMSPSALRERIKENKNNFLVVDCRHAGLVHMVIPHSVRVATSANDEKKFDVGPITHQLAQGNIQTVVLVGTSDLDPKPSEVAERLSQNDVSVYGLKGGFQSWSFLSKYRWDNENNSLLRRVKRTEGRVHPAPIRFKKHSKLAPTIKILPDEKSKPHSVSPSVVTQEEMGHINTSRQKKSQKSIQPK